MLEKLIDQVRTRQSHLEHHANIEGWPLHLRDHLNEQYNDWLQLAELVKQQEDHKRDTEG